MYVNNILQITWPWFKGKLLDYISLGLNLGSGYGIGLDHWDVVSRSDTDCTCLGSRPGVRMCYVYEVTYWTTDQWVMIYTGCKLKTFSRDFVGNRALFTEKVQLNPL